jgi:hypothetical protein
MRQVLGGTPRPYGEGAQEDATPVYEGGAREDATPI